MRTVGVDLHTPDFQALARAYGRSAEHLSDPAELDDRLRAALRSRCPTLIELQERPA